MELLLDGGLAHVHVEELEVERRVCVDGHLLVRLDNLLDLDVDEVVERVEVLLDQAAHLLTRGLVRVRAWRKRAQLQQGWRACKKAGSRRHFSLTSLTGASGVASLSSKQACARAE